MIHSQCPVLTLEQVAENIFVLAFLSHEISTQVEAGQFVNIKVDQRFDPLLRRPYSVHRTDGDNVEILFNVVGKGSSVLYQKKLRERIDVLGPLGVPFSLRGQDFDTAVLVGGGLGVAPLPLATRTLMEAQKSIITLLGARTASQLVERDLQNVEVATDDGSRGLKGTVVDLLREHPGIFSGARIKIFACGPTKMLRKIADFALKREIPCEVSLEGSMACGFGICQGCPVELIYGEKKYALTCTDGPTFDVRRIRI